MGHEDVEIREETASASFRWRISTLLQLQLAAAIVVVCALRPHLIAPVGCVAAIYATGKLTIRIVRRSRIDGVPGVTILWIILACITSMVCSILLGEFASDRHADILTYSRFILTGVAPWIAISLQSIARRSVVAELIRLTILGIWLVVLPFFTLELIVYLLFEGYFDFFLR